MSLSWPSPVIVKLQNGTDSPFARPITENEGSWIVSGGFLLGVATSFLGGILLDKIGRKYSIILVSLPKLCASISCIFITEVWALIIARAIWIFCDCFTLAFVPVYSSEIASKEHRGSLGTLLQLFSCLGIVIALSVGPFVSYKALNIFIATVIAVTNVPILFLPDSPYYLYSKGREEEAKKILIFLRESDTLIKNEIEDYKLWSQEKTVDRIALLKNKVFLKSLSLSILLCVGSNLTGFNAVSFYLQTIIESTRTKLRSDIASVVIGCIQIFAALCATLVSNKFGRRTILLASLSGIFLGLVGLGTFFKVSESDGFVVSGFMNYIPLISLILVIFFYSSGIGSLIWLVMAELFDSQSRAFGVSLSLIMGTLVIFLTTKYFPIVTLVAGAAATYFFFSAMCVVIGSLIAIFLPETKGKTFQEIQTELQGSVNLKDGCDKEKQISEVNL
ncbi:facilitated trehalose transporter Tret1-like isoform X2 [Danaus plexippus]|nr:facilitated trehalose transporter Tret1-like isoform X2 [Danaus plexippus]